MDLQPLTSERLPTVPKLDKKQFISSYVQGQNMHAKSYAEEGRVVSSSWNVQHLTPEKQSPAVSNYPQNVGFSTPILTARMARLKKELERPEIENDMPNKTEAKKSSRVPNKETQAKPKPSDNPPAKSQKPLPKKRAADLHSDEDQAARLSERRRRKRIKRAIVQPEKGSDHDIASSSGDNKTKKRTRAKGNKPKIPAGLALMHGFTATNVGKNRLTLKPPSNVGVFKKGKASINIKTKQKEKITKKGRATRHFSELKFLNHTQETPKVAPEPLAFDSDSSSTSTEENPEPEQSGGVYKSRKAKVSHKLSESSEQASAVSEVSAPQAQKGLCVESEIWDIESRASEKRKTLSGDGASYIQGTVVVDARNPAWRDRIAKSTKMASVVNSSQESAKTDVPAAPMILSSPSLRPSQSASNTGNLLVKPDRAMDASPYFSAPTIKDTKSREPDSALVKHTPPLEPVSVRNREDADFKNVFSIPSEVSDLAPPNLTKTRFVVPLRTRVFANQFPSVPDVLSQAEDLYHIHHSVQIVADGALGEYRESECDACTQNPAEDYDTFPGNLEADYVSDAELALPHPIEGPFHHALYGESRLQNVNSQDSEVYVFDESQADACEGEIFKEFPNQCDYIEQAALEHPEMVEPGAYGDYSEDDLPIDSQSEYGTYYDLHEGTVEPPMYVLDEFDVDTRCEAFQPWDNMDEGFGEQLEFGDVPGDVPDTWDDVDDEFSQGSLANAPGEAPVEPSDLMDNGSDVSDQSRTYAPCFSQGRALLLGLPARDPVQADRPFSSRPHLSHAEEDVAKVLRGHWRPQRL